MKYMATRVQTAIIDLDGEVWNEEEEDAEDVALQIANDMTYLDWDSEDIYVERSE